MTVDRGTHRGSAPSSHAARRRGVVGSRLTAAVGVLAVAVAAAGAATAQDGTTPPSRELVVQAPGSSLALPRTVEPQTSRGGVDREVLARQTELQARQRSRALAALTEKNKRRATQLKSQAKRAAALAALTEKNKRRAAQLKSQAKRTAALAALTEKNKRRAAQLKSQAKHAAALPAANQWVLPVTGYRLTGRFGDTSPLWSTFHTGLDFAAPSGTKIVSVAEGTVTKAGWGGAYGNQTIVTLEDGTEIWYCHQTSINVSVGDTVDPGQAIGTIGATGNVTGPHLHLEVRPDGGDPVDPYAALQDHDVNP